MTTRVTVKNEETSGHSIEVKFAGQTSIVAPGNSITSHVWQGSGMEIKEVPTIKAAEPDASGAKVYKQLDDDTYEEIPQRKFALGAKLPDDWLGLTAEELKSKRVADASLEKNLRPLT